MVCTQAPARASTRPLDWPFDDLPGADDDRGHHCERSAHSEDIERDGIGHVGSSGQGEDEKQRFRHQYVKNMSPRQMGEARSFRKCEINVTLQPVF